MNDMKKSLIVHKYSIENWTSLKTKLLSLIENENLIHRNEGELVKSNYAETEEMTNFEKNTANALNGQFTRFAKDIQKNLSIQRIWFEIQDIGDVHPMHDHGYVGWSGALYVKYDHTCHTGLFFENNASLQVNEGDICFFPSHWLHGTLPNKSTKRRIIISFNLKEIHE